MIADREFSQRVLERVKLAEQKRLRRDGLKFLLPLTLIVVVGVTWAVAFFDGITALRIVIEIVALVVAIGGIGVAATIVGVERSCVSDASTPFVSATRN